MKIFPTCSPKRISEAKIGELLILPTENGPVQILGMGLYEGGEVGLLFLTAHQKAPAFGVISARSFGEGVGLSLGMEFEIHLDPKTVTSGGVTDRPGSLRFYQNGVVALRVDRPETAGDALELWLDVATWNPPLHTSARYVDISDWDILLPHQEGGDVARLTVFRASRRVP